MIEFEFVTVVTSFPTNKKKKDMKYRQKEN